MICTEAQHKLGKNLNGVASPTPIRRVVHPGALVPAR
jgi:hypothetical protein